MSPFAATVGEPDLAASAGGETWRSPHNYHIIISHNYFISVI